MQLNEPSPKRAIGVYLLLFVPLLWYIFSGSSAPSTEHGLPWFWPLLVPVYLFGESGAFILFTVLGFVLIGTLVSMFMEV